MATNPMHDERQAFIDSLTPEELNLLAGYEALAADEEQEKECMEWCEGVIRDIAP